MKPTNIYKVILPYSESANPKKRFKVEYTIEANDRNDALLRAEREFNSYTANSSASWIRTIDRNYIRVWRILPHLPQTARHIDELVLQLSNSDDDVVYNTLLALKDLEDTTASSAIIKLLKHDSSDLVVLAVEALNKMGDPSNYHIVLSLYNKQTHPKVKAAVVTAAAALATPDDTNLIQFLIDALQDEDSRVRANAVEAIESLQLANSASILLPLIKDEDNRVRANIIKALWRKQDQDHLLASLRSMLVDSDPWMRLSAIFILDKFNIPGKNEALKSMLFDTHPKVSENAKKALLRAEGLDSIPYWLEMISDEKDFEQVESKVLSFGETAAAIILATNPKTEQAKHYSLRLLDSIDSKYYKRSSWVRWLKGNYKKGLD